MLVILVKEIRSFFNSIIGYLVIGVFLLANGLMLWVFRGNGNILDQGFADLSAFFQLAPWILLFLVPAITMRSLAEERKQGTFELLLAKPIRIFSLVLGKYLGSLLVCALAILPTLLYGLAIYRLGNPIGNLDIGSTIGSYLALFMLCSAYTAIGIFASSCTANQIIAFIYALCFCAFGYFGLDGLANLWTKAAFANRIEQLGLQFHYERISSGVLDTRDLGYYILLSLFFVFLTVLQLDRRGNPFSKKSIGMLLLAGIGLVVLANSFFARWDLTADKRFTLSKSTVQLVEEIPNRIAIDVLLEGSFPAEFRRLQLETKQLLNALHSINSDVEYVFTNPFKEEEFRKETLQELQKHGLTPMQVSVQQNGIRSTEVLVPWAIMSYRNKSVKIPLVKHTMGATTVQRVNQSIQQLEYTFADGLKKLLHPKKHKIAVLRGNGQLPDKKIADFIKALQAYYFLAPFTLDSVSNNPGGTLEQLKKYDLFINAKPTEAFSEKEKYVLDQYTMQGGKSLWLIDAVAMELDSVFSRKNQAIALARDLNLKDAFFSYGLRINPVLVNDLYSAPLILASGKGSKTQFTPHRWFYASLAKSNTTHPIAHNIEAVKFEFPSQIDTLKSSAQKTILLQSSDKSKPEGVPKPMPLASITTKPNLKSYQGHGNQNLAVLLEGKFKSTYKQRIKPFVISDPADHSTATKMIVVADGDIIKNGVRKGKPTTLGLDPYLNMQYGNKEFLVNAVNYLLDDSGLIDVRSKRIAIPFLDPEKIARSRTFWQLVTTIFPILLLFVLAYLRHSIRKRKYGSALNIG